VSFDLQFVTRAPGQSWEEAYEALGDAGEPAVLTADRRALWDRLLAELAPLLPEAESVVESEFAELTDEAIGLQLSLFDTEVAISVAYWHSGEEADRVVALLREVAAVVERVTGLTAYDPQAGMPFLQGGSAEAGASMSRIADGMADGSLFGAVPHQPKPTHQPQRRSLWQRLTGR